MSDAKELPELQLKDGSSKAEIRLKVWDYLEDNRLAAFPRPAHRRMSNFRGSEQAAERAVSLDVFKNAGNVRSDPDRPLMPIRMKTLKAGKSLFVPTPGMLNHVVSKLSKPLKDKTYQLRTAVSRQGVIELGDPVDVDDCSAPMDLIVVGSVAVSPKGWRIGKGKGLSDLEYAMMVSTGLVDSNVAVATLVHDCQVVDLPDDLFGPHDVPVDYIVTPTRVIECCNRGGDESSDPPPPKPLGVIWSLLTSADLDRLPVLRRLRYREWKASKDVRLSGEESAPADLEDIVLPEVHPENTRKTGPRVRKPGRPKLAHGEVKAERETSSGETDEAAVKDDDDDRKAAPRQRQRRRRLRPRRRRPVPEASSGSGSDRSDASSKENRHQLAAGGGANSSSSQLVESLPRRRRRPSDCAGSVYVGALPYRARVGSLKAEVRERNVHPVEIFWRAFQGFAFLNFRTVEDAELALDALAGLQIGKKIVRLEMARRVAAVAAVVGADGEGGSGQRRSRRHRWQRSDRSNGETTTDSGTSDDAVKTELPEEPIDVEDVKIEEAV